MSIISVVDWYSVFCYPPGMADEATKLNIREVIELKKFDGEPPAFEGEKEPIEVRTLVYENGALISSEIKTKETAPHGTD